MNEWNRLVPEALFAICSKCRNLPCIRPRMEGRLVGCLDRKVGDFGPQSLGSATPLRHSASRLEPNRMMGGF